MARKARGSAPRTEHISGRFRPSTAAQLDRLRKKGTKDEISRTEMIERLITRATPVEGRLAGVSLTAAGEGLGSIGPGGPITHAPAAGGIIQNPRVGAPIIIGE